MGCRTETSAGIRSCVARAIGLCLISIPLPTGNLAAQSASDIAVLMEQLESPRFADREQATYSLAQVGEPAIAAIVQAAAGAKTETCYRAWKALNSMKESGSADLLDVMDREFEKTNRTDKTFSKLVENLLTIQDPPDSELPEWARDHPQRPLTSEEKSKRAKRMAYQRLCDNIQRQITRLEKKQEKSGEAARYSEAIRQLKRKYRTVLLKRNRIK